MTYKRKKMIIITAFIIIAAITVVICVGYFNRGEANKFDGILVHSGPEQIREGLDWFGQAQFI